MFEGICDAIHREMEVLEEKYSNGKNTMNIQDLEHIDRMAHALKSIATYEAMKGSGEYGSYVRSRATGRYGRDEYPYDRRY